MTTIPIEAEVSTEQLLRAVEQLPPREFAAFLVQLLAHLRGVRRAMPVSTPDGESHSSSASMMEHEGNPYLAAAGMFADDAFAAEVDAYITAQREREREEAALEADVLLFDPTAVRRDQELRKVYRRLGTKDRCIAAIAQVHRCTLVTRNTVHFQGIADLALENWIDDDVV